MRIKRLIPWFLMPVVVTIAIFLTFTITKFITEYHFYKNYIVFINTHQPINCPSSYKLLNATKSQQKQIRRFIRSFAPEDSKLLKQFIRERISLYQMMIEPNPDTARIRIQVNQAATKQTDLEFHRVVYLLNVNGILTPAQQKIFTEKFIRKAISPWAGQF
jgi:Spy/CpxP family protein refolding chaperone